MTLQQIQNFILDVPDFPKKGILFKDITPLLENSEAFLALIRHMSEAVPSQCTHLVAIESRGFILGAALSQHVKKGLVLVRKPGKLPRTTIKKQYSLEYGSDAVEIHKESLKAGDRVVIIDDVLATGGTAAAVESLCFEMGAQVLKHIFLMELQFLQGQKKLKSPVQSLIQY